MRLGEFLVSKKIVTDKQLEHALDAQLSYGGHLGTCLFELGYVTEELLGEVLSTASGMKYAPREQFQDIPPEVLDALPQKLVEKHHVIPFRLECKILDVAMIDPSNLQAIDELSFAAGYRIEPWISPEVRIFEAMERYYDVPRRVRYVTLCSHLDDSRTDKAPTGSPGGVVDTGRSGEGGPDSEPGWLLGQRTGKERSLGLAVAPCPVEAPNLHTVPRRGNAAMVDELVEPDDPLELVADLLCRSEGRGQIARVILGHAVRGMMRCVLFKVLNGTAGVWDVAGIGADREDLSKLHFPIISEPIFALLRGHDYYRGTLPAAPQYRGFFEKLGLDPPAEILLLPVYLNDRLVALFYGDGGTSGTIRGETEDYRRLVKKLALSLQIVVLKRKIRSI